MDSVTWDCPTCGNEHKTPLPLDRCNHVCKKCEQVVSWKYIVVYSKRWHRQTIKVQE